MWNHWNQKQGMSALPSGGETGLTKAGPIRISETVLPPKRPKCEPHNSQPATNMGQGLGLNSDLDGQT